MSKCPLLTYNIRKFPFNTTLALGSLRLPLVIVAVIEFPCYWGYCLPKAYYTEHRSYRLQQWFSTTVICLHRLSALPGTILVVTLGRGVLLSLFIEARDAAKPLAGHRMALHSKEPSSLNCQWCWGWKLLLCCCTKWIEPLSRSAFGWLLRENSNATPFPPPHTPPSLLPWLSHLLLPACFNISLS